MTQSQRAAVDLQAAIKKMMIHAYKLHGTLSYTDAMAQLREAGLRDLESAVLAFANKIDVADVCTRCMFDPQIPETVAPDPGTKSQ